MGTLMATLSAGSINTALPAIADDFDISLDLVQWVVSSYMLVIACLLPLFGKISDIYGRRKVFAVGMLILSIGSLFCGFSNSIYELILYRVFQAVGAAMMMSNNLAVITAVFPENERGRAMGMSNSTVAVGTLLGPGIGGFLIDFFGWNSVFFFVVPLGILSFTMSLLVMPKNLKEEDKSGKFDYAGSVLFSFAILTFMLGIINGNKYNWNETILFLLAVSLFSLIIFVVNEKKQLNPIIDIKLLKKRKIIVGLSASFFSFLTLRPILLLVPFYLKEVVELSASGIGMVLTSMPLAMALSAPFAGKLSDKLQPVYITTIGLIISLIGHLSLLQLNVDSALSDIYIRLFLVGIGRGIFQAPNNSSIMGSVKGLKLGLTGSLISLIRNAANVVGIALSVVIFNNIKSEKILSYNKIMTKVVEKEIFLESFQFVILCSCILLFIGIISSSLRGKKHTHHLTVNVK
jgi:EmrB/QacA subfamily drug resistance transporter